MSGDHAEPHPLERRRAAPVARVADQLDDVAISPRDEPERTGTDGFARQVIVRAEGNDRRGRERQVRQQRGVGRLAHEIEGVVVEHLEAIDGGEQEGAP